MQLVIAVLATWRVTHLLASEDGPADLIVRLRALLGRSLAGQLMDCFLCLSLWIAAPAALFVARRPMEWCFCWLALSGGACLLERVGREMVMEPVSQRAGEARSDVLWAETHGTETGPSGAEGAESLEPETIATETRGCTASADRCAGDYRGRE